MTDRGSKLQMYRFEWPALDAAFFASLTGWLMAGVLLGLTIWLARGALRSYAPEPFVQGTNLN